VHAGLFFAASDRTQIEIGLPGGCWSCLWSGEGIVMKFTGPATIFTQNRNPKDMYKLLNPYRHHRHHHHGGQGGGAVAAAM